MPDPLKTYFHPAIRYDGTTDHAVRMPFAIGIQMPDGEKAFGKISTHTSEAEKIRAIKTYTGVIDALAREEENRARNSELWQLFLAAKLNFTPFAVQDTRHASRHMRGLVGKLFFAAQNTKDDTLKEMMELVTIQFNDMAGHDYSDRVGNDRTPNRRALCMLKQILKIQPKMHKNIHNSNVRDELGL